MLKTLSLILLILIIVFGLFVLFYFSKLAKQSNGMNPQLGVTDGQLSACPGTPNCVCSQSTIESENIQAFTGGIETFTTLRNIIADDESANIITEKEGYVHATYQSKLFGFIDDLELYLNDDRIEVRSASRTGKSDLGANRKRVEALKAML